MLSTITGDDAKRAREALGASQTAVSAAIGVNRTYYSLFEAGRYVLDEQEQGQLREYFGSALPAPGSETDTDDSRPLHARTSRHSRTASATAPAHKPEDRIANAVAALTVLRTTAAAPNGLRGKRTAEAVGDAVAALEPFDYSELLALASDRAVPTTALPDLETFNSLRLSGMKLWESRATGLLICDALYGGQWSDLNFEALKGAESHLHRILGEDVVKYKELWLWAWDDAEKHAPLRRAELAPFVVQAAHKRGAPKIAQTLSLPDSRNP